jgi:hypothetical protein
MQKRIIIPQKVIIFKENDRDVWLKELRKENPFKNDYRIIPSIVPFYNRNAIIEKAKERQDRYFRECCALKDFSSKFKKGYYTHSIQLLYAKKWRKINNPPKESFQRELFDDLHYKRYFPPEKLKAAQDRILKSEHLIQKNIDPKMPDIWLVKDYPHSLFIEAKGLLETFKKGQKEGLAIIKKYLGCDVCVARVFSENENHQGLEFEDIDITDIYLKV